MLFLPGLVAGSRKFVVAGGSSLLRTIANPNSYDTPVQDAFGQQTAITDNYAIIAGQTEDDVNGLDAGVAYIFNPATGGLLHTINHPNELPPTSYEAFASAVGISPTYSIVGVKSEADVNYSGSGKSYIYNNLTGALLHSLDNPNIASISNNDNFGVSVAISDTYAVVGAFGEDPGGASNGGAAFIYNSVTGALLHSIPNPNAYGSSAGDRFGANVAISDNYVVIAAPVGEDNYGNGGSGLVYVYNPVTGALLHTLANPNTYGARIADNFGTAVSISDTYLIVGVHSDDSATANSSGAIHIYDTVTGTKLWSITNPNTDTGNNGDQFGYSVGISDTLAVVGANVEDDGANLNSGIVYVYDPATGGLLQTILNPNDFSTTAGDFFGQSVSISTSYILAGAHQEDEATGLNSGVAYIFTPPTP